MISPRTVGDGANNVSSVFVRARVEFSISDAISRVCNPLIINDFQVITTKYLEMDKTMNKTLKGHRCRTFDR
jgi:hypothetical protein